MGPVPGAAESKEPLQESDNSDGHLETVGEAEPRRNCRKCNYYKKHTVVLTVALAAAVFLGLIMAVSVLAGPRPSADLGPPVGPTCPDGWIGYRGKCYYFSEAEGNWTYSQSHCSSLSASLAGIDNEQDLAFLLRYKGKPDHWIGLWRDPGQPWKWANEFNSLFPIGRGGDCAYLNDKYKVSSSQCTSERYWICTKPDAFTQAKEAAAEGDS
ncbi:C-type lectin domain family 2 member D-like [Mauremys reevesii]|uniref:C-type lectin domain family 2 member D-like n=1 Tax=Mauremys reevesii TaxID=260615 RepID=UPI00193FBB7F|nr:C-type lectin domain family 2 member D-like [Mauremys reevesii]